MKTLRVLNPGMLTTVQDLGRLQYSHLGISAGGAADQLSLRIANRIVGNPDNAPGLEMTLVGGRFEFAESCTVAIAGARGSADTPFLKAIDLPAGAVLDCGILTGGSRSYLAIAGGINVPTVLGSSSTHLAAGFGGWHGRALRKGDVLSLGEGSVPTVREVSQRIHKLIGPRHEIRVTPGVQEDWFVEESVEDFYNAEYEVSDHSNRLGLRLIGTAVRQKHSQELLTEGVSLGAVQVPSDGQPIILFVDQQTTGGYPKIANVISADLHAVAQLRPRDRIRFNKVTLAEALDELRVVEQILTEDLPACQ